MNRIHAILLGIAAASAAGLAFVGCEEDAGNDGASGSFVSRDVLADGTVVMVYEDTIATPSNTAVIVTTTITQPAGGSATTNITFTPIGGPVIGTNTVTSAGRAGLSRGPAGTLPPPRAS